MSLLSTSLFEHDQTSERDGVSKDLQGGNFGSESKDGSGDEEDILENTGKSQDETRSNTDQKDGGNVQSKRETGVGEENKESNSVESVEWLESLGEGENAKVDDGTDWSVVVEGDNRIHLQPVEEKLNHDQSRGFETERGDLTQESKELKVDFSVGGKGTSSRDKKDDDDQSLVWLLDLEGERDEQDGNRVEGLEHLDERD